MKHNLYALFCLAFIIAGMSYIGHVELADCEKTNFEVCDL